MTVSADTYRCGHERTAGNTRVKTRAGSRYPACRLCANAYARRHQFRRRHPLWPADRPVPDRPVRGPVVDLIVAALRQHPGGLTPRELRARLGYRQSVASIWVTVRYHRKRGLPVVSVPSSPGHRVTYRLLRPEDPAS